MEKKSLLIIDYAGDYRETYKRLMSGGKQTYFAQHYSIDVVADALKQFDHVTAAFCVTEEAYDEVLDNGVRAIGLGLPGHPDRGVLEQLITSVAPTHLVFRSFFTRTIIWASARYENIVCCLANSLPEKGIVRYLKNRRIGWILNARGVRWVFAYGRSSAEGFVRAGVDPAKVVPWDFLHDLGRHEGRPPDPRPEGAVPKVMYVGLISEAKGVGDLLDAIALLRRDGFPIHLGIAGDDPEGRFATRAAELGIAGDVSFYGRIDNDDLEDRMREHDAVVVPSRWDYPEGFPLVIAQALRAGVPVVVSDHPMFTRSLDDGRTAMIARQRQPDDLAAAMRRLLSTPALWTALAQASRETLKRVEVNVKFRDAIERCFVERPSDGGFLDVNSMAKTKGGGR